MNGEECCGKFGFPLSGWEIMSVEDGGGFTLISLCVCRAIYNADDKCNQQVPLW